MLQGKEYIGKVEAAALLGQPTRRCGCEKATHVAAPCELLQLVGVRWVGVGAMNPHHKGMPQRGQDANLVHRMMRRPTECMVRHARRLQREFGTAAAIVEGARRQRPPKPPKPPKLPAVAILVFVVVVVVVAMVVVARERRPDAHHPKQPPLVQPPAQHEIVHRAHCTRVRNGEGRPSIRRSLHRVPGTQRAGSAAADATAAAARGHPVVYGEHSAPRLLQLRSLMR